MMSIGVLFFLIDGFLLIQSQSKRVGLSSTSDYPLRYSGVIHVHSLYSDGGGTVDDIIESGHKTGLDFIILTDHDTLQARLDGKQGYHSDILLIVGEEVNTSSGHLLSLGVGYHVQQKGPLGLPLLLDKISKAGGVSLIAHPTGRRPWIDWTVDNVDGLEIFNADTAWRDDNILELIRALFFLPIMPLEAFNSLIDRPSKSIQLWLNHSQQTRLSIVGSAYAQERIPIWQDLALPFPSYEDLFGLIRTYVITEVELTGDSVVDEDILLNSIRRGSCYVVLEGYETAPGFSFDFNVGAETFPMGARTKYKAGGQIEVVAPSSGAIRIKLYRNGKVLAETDEQKLLIDVPGPGLYHAEVYQLRSNYYLKESLRIWIISNSIMLK